MKPPRGFAKNYFTFAAVLAHSVIPTLHSRAISSSLLLTKTSFLEDATEEEPPQEELLLTPCELNAKPCLCNVFYKLKTKIALLINHYIPRCPYYTVCFAFRRSGVHPPL
ncbi:MAG: hypothetical protein JXQ67_02855 [Campylobacterales bacterium]|nr:hypothetical protein [Campylobacterales bacterium]